MTKESKDREKRDREVLTNPDLRGVSKGRRSDESSTGWDVSDPAKVESTWERWDVLNDRRR